MTDAEHMLGTASGVWPSSDSCSRRVSCCPVPNSSSQLPWANQSQRRQYPLVDLCATEAAHRQPRNLPAISALRSGHDELYQVYNLILRQVALQTILERFRNTVSLFLEVLVAGAWQRAMTHLRLPESSDR